MAAWDFLPFHPHPLCRGRHAQTVASTLQLIRLPPNRATLHFVALADGDQLALHDDQPAAWQPGNRTSLMVHGLGGSHASGYMRRIAAKLNGIGVRTFRLDLRGCGAGFGFAKQPYYGGCSDDLAATVRRVGELCPGSPLSLIGFSLGANVVLKLLGELRGRPLAGVDHAMAISPPIDLERCSQSLLQGFNRVYDRYFVATLMRLIRRQAIRVPDSPAARFRERPRSLFEFDDRFTAPTWGFSGARDYYRQCSSLALLGQIEVPTIVITARDDPFIPYKAIESAKLSADVALHATPSGGHLGFIAGRNADPDRHWLDWRVVDCHRALNTRQSCNAKLN